MGTRYEEVELPEKTLWLFRKGSDKNNIQNYYGYSEDLAKRTDEFEPAHDLPGKHAIHKDPKYMTKDECVDEAKIKFDARLPGDMNVSKMRGEIRKLRLEHPEKAAEPMPEQKQDEPVSETNDDLIKVLLKDQEETIEGLNKTIEENGEMFESQLKEIETLKQKVIDLEKQIEDISKDKEPDEGL